MVSPDPRVHLVGVMGRLHVGRRVQVGRAQVDRPQDGVVQFRRLQPVRPQLGRVQVPPGLHVGVVGRLHDGRVDRVGRDGRLHRLHRPHDVVPGLHIGVVGAVGRVGRAQMGVALHVGVGAVGRLHDGRVARVDRVARLHRSHVEVPGLHVGMVGLVGRVGRAHVVEPRLHVGALGRDLGRPTRVLPRRGTHGRPQLVRVVPLDAGPPIRLVLPKLVPPLSTF